MYSSENSKLRREVENLKATEQTLRSTKTQLDSEKEMRLSATFDISKLRHEISDLIAEKAKSKNIHDRAMNDLTYQN